MFKREKESIYSFGKLNDFESKYEQSPKQKSTISPKPFKSLPRKKVTSPIPSIGKIGTGVGQKMMMGYY